VYYFEKTCYVRGGYGRLFKAMTEKIIENGSQIKLSTGVKRIICERKAVKGVVTENGEEFFARTVISNANAIETLSGFLDDGLLRQKYEQKFSQLEKSISAFQVYLGLNTTAKALGMTNFMFSINTSYDHTENFKANLDENFDNCFIELVDHSQVDPSLAPQGKSTLLIMTFDSYGRWQDLTAEQYRQKKEMLARKLIQRSEKYLPGLAKHIEIMEIATPKTMQRYTLSPEGAIYGFAHTPGQSGIFRLGQKTDVRGLFLAGSWTRPGAGIHACFISGLDAAELALKFLD
jgi:phytoene dehydrogenase-like protein